MRLIGRGARQPLDAFVEEWWVLYAQPSPERSTLTVYRWAWEQHARPRLGGLRLRDVTPLTIARFRASLEANHVGAESIRKTLTMLQSVFQRAVEWQVLEANPVRAARKPPLGRADGTGDRATDRRGDAGGSAGAWLSARCAPHRPAGLRRAAARGGARSRMAARARAHAGGRAGGLGRAREGVKNRGGRGRCAYEVAVEGLTQIREPQRVIIDLVEELGADS